MNYLIGISGKAGHGKDSLADFLDDVFCKKYHGCYSERIGFADKLKEFAADLLDVDYDSVDTQAGKLTEISHMGNITGRQVLLTLGTEIGRQIYSDIWVYHYKKKVNDSFNLRNTDVVFTSDLRFQNEYDAIKGYKETLGVKPITIRVIRPDFVMSGTEHHPSETGLDRIDKWNYKIVADNLDELKKEAEKIFALIVK